MKSICIIQHLQYYNEDLNKIEGRFGFISLFVTMRFLGQTAIGHCDDSETKEKTCNRDAFWYQKLGVRASVP